MNVDQEAAWENVGITITQNVYQQIKGDNSQDMLKRRPAKTFGGMPIKTSIHATIQRIDVIALKHWGRGVTKEVDLFEEGGQTVFQLYGQSGGLLAGYISYFDTVFQRVHGLPAFRVLLRRSGSASRRLLRLSVVSSRAGVMTSPHFFTNSQRKNSHAHLK
jgi:hypothetical protein